MIDENTKYRVTMRNIWAVDGGQREEIQNDFVPLHILEGYVAQARANWQSVTVSEEPDWGPGGPDGETTIPAGLGGN